MKTYIDEHCDAGLKGLRISMKGHVDQEWMVNVPLYGVIENLFKKENIKGK